jgi:drug/metabolite transporter (DMT)-like permease
MTSEYFAARLPLFYVFLSGIGFSFQTLIIKVLAEGGFHASFQCIFFRGFTQFLLASYFVYFDEDRRSGKGPKLFGNTSYVRFMLFMRSFIGFGGIAFSFLAVELIPMGDATVLIMLSPLITSILSYFILAEPWRLPELIATIVSLAGVVMVAKPPAIFGGSTVEPTSFYTGVVYGLVSAVSAAFAYLFVRILGTTAKMPWSNVCFSQSIGQMVLSIPCLYIFGQHIELDLTLFQYSMLILGGTIGAVSQILMTMGMQREKSAAATGMRMSDVAFGYLWQVRVC